MEDQNWTAHGAAPPREAFWVEWVLRHGPALPGQPAVKDGRKTSDRLVVGLVRHAGQAFMADAPDGDPILAADRHYQDIALSYLRALEKALFAAQAQPLSSSKFTQQTAGAWPARRLVDSLRATVHTHYPDGSMNLPSPI